MNEEIGFYFFSFFYYFFRMLFWNLSIISCWDRGKIKEERERIVFFGEVERKGELEIEVVLF
jgi:hypothetical protein